MTDHGPTHPVLAKAWDTFHATQQECLAWMTDSARFRDSRAQAAATVMSILDTFDDDKRIVFALVELEQLSVPEVARMLDINLNTAYSRLRLARAAFEQAVRARVARGRIP